MTATATAKPRLVTIPYTPRREQKEIHAGIESRRWSVIVAHRRMGKTVCMINHLIKQACMCTLREPRYAYFAPLRNQAKTIAWDYLKYYTRPIDGVEKNESELWIRLPNGAKISICGADNPDSLRGQYLDGVVLDEVAQMKPQVWGEAIRPALADRGGWAVFIGTPKGANLFSELYQQALQNPDEWFAGLYRADQTTALKPAELDAQRKELSPAQFRQEYLCDFGASSDDNLIPLDLAEAASTREIVHEQVRGAAKIMGVDVARFGGDRSALAKRQGICCYPLQTWQGLDNIALADRIATAIRDWQPDAVFIDAGGGAGVIDYLRNQGYRINEINFGGRPLQENKYYNKRAEMWGEMRDWLQRGGAIPRNPELVTDLSGPKYGYDQDGSRIKLESKDSMKARGVRSPDLGDALALTFASKVRPGAGMLAGGGIKNTFAKEFDPFAGI